MAPRVPIAHGTSRGYARGCKCDICKAAGSRYNRRIYNEDEWLESLRSKAKKSRLGKV